MTYKNQIFNFSISGFQQQSCVLCGSPSEKNSCLCQPCLEELPFIEQACKTCGLPTTESVIRCGACITVPPLNNIAVILLQYVAPVDHLIKNMKYHNQLAIADLLGQLLADKIKSQPDDLPEQIIPVPLHNSRLQTRGYNQAVEIARPVSKALNIPVNLTSCLRNRATEPQVELPHEERQSNVKNAFEIIHQTNVKHVAILDDVMTTGSTMNELTRILLNSGVERVDIWACTRATLD